MYGQNPGRIYLVPILLLSIQGAVAKEGSHSFYLRSSVDTTSCHSSELRDLVELSLAGIADQGTPEQESLKTEKCSGQSVFHLLQSLSAGRHPAQGTLLAACQNSSINSKKSYALLQA